MGISYEKGDCSSMAEHVVMISGDAHIGSGQWWGAEEYVDPEYRELYLEQQAANPPVSWTPEMHPAFSPQPTAGRGVHGMSYQNHLDMNLSRLEFVKERIGDPVEAGKLVTWFATSGDMDHEYRIKELEADG